MDLRKRRTANLTQPKTYRMTVEAIAAIEDLSIALQMPMSKVMEMAVVRLRDEWRAGRVKGVGLLVEAGSMADG